MRHWSTVSTGDWLDNGGFLCMLPGCRGHGKRVAPPTANGLGCLRASTMLSDNLFWLISTNCTHLPLSFPLNCKGKKGIGGVGSKQYWQIGLCSHFELWSTQLGVRMYRFWDHTCLIFTNSTGVLVVLCMQISLHSMLITLRDVFTLISASKVQNYSSPMWRKQHI